MFSIIFTVYQGKIHEEKIISHISLSEEKIVSEIKKITPTINVTLKKIYIVKTKLNVRKKPSSNSLILDCLFPNNKVEFIKENGNWFYVEYFDFLEGVPKYGWVYSNYLAASKAN